MPGMRVALILCVLSRVGPQPLPTPERPVTDVYVEVGSSFSLTCGPVPVEWRRNGTLLAQGWELTVYNSSLTDQGTYSCRTAAGDTPRTFHVQPGYPPLRPHVRCWSHDYPLGATCSWSDPAEPALPTRHTASYSLYRSEWVRGCEPSGGGRCALRGLQLFSLQPYVFNVTAVNPLGSATQLHSFILEDIVKPDPPSNVTVSPGPSRQVTVSWDPPPTWTDLALFPLKYWVKYWREDKEQMRILGPYALASATLKGLRPGQYHVQVSAKEMLDLGENSEWTEPVIATVTQ